MIIVTRDVYRIYHTKKLYLKIIVTFFISGTKFFENLVVKMKKFRGCVET